MKNALKHLVGRLMFVFAKLKLKFTKFNFARLAKAGKSTASFLIIATFSFLVINYALAWTNPSQNPPGGAGALIYANNNVGIGVTPTTKLDIDGQIKIRGGVPGANKILTSDASGLATWETPASGMPSGTTGQTLRHDGSSWTASSILLNTGARIGINSAAPGGRLVVLGEGTTSATYAFNAANSSGTSILFARDDGNVGIGTTSPGEKLEVSGNFKINEFRIKRISATEMGVYDSTNTLVIIFDEGS